MYINLVTYLISVLFYNGLNSNGKKLASKSRNSRNTIKMKPVYDWKLGDIALAKISMKMYAKVRVVKNEDGLFHDEKGRRCRSYLRNMNFSASTYVIHDYLITKSCCITVVNGELIVTNQLCYYVQIIRSQKEMWLPYSCMYLAERSRPFYGPNIRTPVKNLLEEKPSPRKRKIIEDHILPLSVKPHKSKTPDFNVSYEIRQMPLKQGKYENAFKEFVRRGKETLFDEYFEILKLDNNRNEDLHYLNNVDASTEDKFELVIKNIASEKEIENYLRQCWRYNFVHKQSDKDTSDSSKMQSSETPVITVHATWCLVCGEKDRLRECTNCPSTFHLACRKEWLVSIIHRKNPPKKVQKPILIEKILSSTRMIRSVQEDKENMNLCPSCMWGPKIGYDDVVWHKLGSCPWWPARVLTPGEMPSCLLSRSHSPHQWPLKYYGTLNYSWGDSHRMCLFLPKHTGALEARDDMLKQAVLEACDDYITVYLT